MAQGFGNGSASTAFALSAGVITAFNPCGFAMLPAYVSYFVGTDGGRDTTIATRLLRALKVGTLVTLGFMTVYGFIGVVASGLRSAVTNVVPYVSMVVGVALAILGVSMLRGFAPKLPFLQVNAAKNKDSARSMYLYGISYAVVSLSCGFAGFSAAVVTSFESSSFLDGLLVYIAFAAGMGLVLMTLSLAVAFAQQAFVRGMRRVLPYINRLSGVLLVLAGLYVAYYGYYEWRVILRGETAPEGPVAWVTSWSGHAQRFVDGVSTTTMVLGLLVLGAIAAFSVAWNSTSKTPSLDTSATGGAASNDRESTDLASNDGQLNDRQPIEPADDIRDETEASAKV